MLDSILGFGAKLLGMDVGLFGQLLVGVLSLNALLSGVNEALKLFMDKTSGDGDNKAQGIVAKVLGYLQKAIDFLSANAKH